MHKTLAILTTALALTAARADEPKKPDVQTQQKKEDRSALTPEKLGEMLKDLAYEPEDISTGKTKDFYKISSEQNGWKIFINISLSSDRTIVWFEAKFAPLADPDAAPTAAWLKLLQLTEENAPAHFALDATNRLHIYEPRDNFGLTPGEMRRAIERFDAVVRNTEPHWKAAAFKPMPKLAPLTEAGRKNLEAMAGTWIVVEEEKNGTKTDAATVTESAITYVFNGDKCRAKSAGSKEVEATLWADAAADAIPLDMAFSSARVIQKAIVKVDGDTMTICIANPEVDRPKEFATTADFKGMKIVLKRQKS